MRFSQPIFAGILFLTAVSAPAAEAAVSEAHILVFNEDALLQNVAPAKRDEFRLAARTVLEELVTANGANIVLSKGAVLSGADTIDATRSIHGALPEPYARRYATTFGGVSTRFPKPTMGPIIFIDDHFFSEAARNKGAAAARVLEGLRKDTGATLIVDKATAILCSIDGMDATREALARLKGGHSSIAVQAAVARILILDRNRLFIRSRAGKTIVAEAKRIHDAGGKTNAAIQGALNKAIETVARALEPILRTMMAERGANLILDRGSVVVARTSDARDITTESTERLDKILTEVPVEVP